MITRLKYNTKFSSTGRSFSNEINFKPGFTVISGRNEGGKSLILEMIEYALFGVAALRGSASSYDILEVELDFTVRGEAHKVVRNGTRITLDKDKAVGAKAVNTEVIKLLKYDMDVFRVGNFAQQGHLNDFTDVKKATERRRMVDELVGLNTLEVVEKICRSESNAIRRLRDDLARRLVEPELPVKPDDYIASLEIDMILRKQIEIKARRDQLIRIDKPVLPEEPEKGNFNDDVEEHEEKRTATESERGILERTLRSIPSALYTRHDLDYATSFYDQQNIGPYPDYSQEELEDFMEIYKVLDRAKESVSCPSCGTRFVPNGGTVDIPTSPPPLTISEVREQLNRHARWYGKTKIECDTDPVVPKNQIVAGYQALAKADTRAEIEKQLADLPVYEDRSKELIEKITYEKKLSSYQLVLQRYMDKLTEWSDAQEELALLPEPDLSLEEKLDESRKYEEQKRRYDADMVTFNETSVELEKLNKQAEDFYNGAECLKFVRSQVKAHLVPSLNKVASFLLEKMTQGQRKKIAVDEDFNVMVDGQPVETLSGSGKSVTNLALRLALGQVLTHNVMSVFMGDELDADMDSERAEGTHKALQEASKLLKQVIIVSHKDIQGDYNIGV